MVNLGEGLVDSTAQTAEDDDVEGCIDVLVVDVSISGSLVPSGTCTCTSTGTDNPSIPIPQVIQRLGKIRGIIIPELDDVDV